MVVLIVAVTAPIIGQYKKWHIRTQIKKNNSGNCHIALYATLRSEIRFGRIAVILITGNTLNHETRMRHQSVG